LGHSIKYPLETACSKRSPFFAIRKVDFQDRLDILLEMKLSRHKWVIAIIVFF
jgi:hypothetical protein